MSQLPSANAQKFSLKFLLTNFFTPLFLITLSLSLILNACSVKSSRLESLKIGITTWPGFDVVLYAKANDLFKKKGLNVELTRFENQQDSSRAVLRGSLDATFASLWDAVQSDPGNDKPAVILVTNISHGADGIVTRSAIKSVEALRGKRVGAKLGTVNHLILLEALKLHQIKPEAVQIEDVDNETAVSLIKQGKLDGAVIWQPLLGKTAEAIHGNIVYTTKELDSLVIDTLLSRSTTIQAKKAELTAFMAVWLEVMQAVEKEPRIVFDAVGRQLGQSGDSFASDYAGLKKGDVGMQQRMFQTNSRLKAAIAQMAQLLREDPRAGRLPREDVEINGELITAALSGWKSQ